MSATERETAVGPLVSLRAATESRSWAGWTDSPHFMFLNTNSSIHQEGSKQTQRAFQVFVLPLGTVSAILSQLDILMKDNATIFKHLLCYCSTSSDWHMSWYSFAFRHNPLVTFSNKDFIMSPGFPSHWNVNKTVSLVLPICVYDVFTCTCSSVPAVCLFSGVVNVQRVPATLRLLVNVKLSC